ncbi:MAG: hypothetical protein ACYTJ0_12770, partial [Planctomycetota bacterium]
MLRYRTIPAILGAIGLLAAGCSSAPEAAGGDPAATSASEAVVVTDPARPLVLPTPGLVAGSGRHAGRNDGQMGRPPRAAGRSIATVEQRQQLWISGNRP